MLLALPIALPFAVAVALYALRGAPKIMRAASVAGAVAQLFVALAILSEVRAAGPFASQMGGWPAPFGITLAADLLSGGLLVATALAGLAATLFGMAEVGERSERAGHHTFLHMLIAGVSGAFVTGDLFNLYVWFEVLLIASFGLLVLRGGRRQLDGAMRYVALNLIATIAFLMGVGLLYGATGALNMADLRGAVAASDAPDKILVTAAFLLFAFGAKAAMFPVFFWLPASYHTPSFTVSAVFAALLTKVGVYSAFRVFTLIYTLDTPYLADMMLWGGAATMLFGVLGAIAQNELRRVLAFQVISSIGFMMAAASIGTQAALAAAIFYLLQDMVLKVNLFLAAWIAARRAGTENIMTAGGLWTAAPLASVLFLIPALSLAGIPPFAGFWAKVLMVDAALAAGYGWLAALALIVGLLTLYSMGRVFAEMFWKARPAETPAMAGEPQLAPRSALLTSAALTALIVWIGVAPEPFIAFAQAAGAQLADPALYVAAVLGDR
jgi:multicomponent Na+:H+ antiporter subunit D